MLLFVGRLREVGTISKDVLDVTVYHFGSERVHLVVIIRFISNLTIKSTNIK